MTDAKPKRKKEQGKPKTTTTPKQDTGKRKKTRRDNAEFPMFDPRFNSRIKREYLDYDYIDQLSEDPTIEMPDGSLISEKEWFHRFNENDLNARFKKDKNNDYDYDYNILNNDELRRESYRRNNARNRCTWGRTKAQNLITDIESIEYNLPEEIENVEDTLIDQVQDNIDSEKILDEIIDSEQSEE